MKPATASPLVLFALLPVSMAQNNNCTIANRFNDYNSSATYPMPALSLSGDSIETDDTKSWYLAPRLEQRGSVQGGEDSLTYMFANTDGSNTSGILMCEEATWAHAVGKYQFPREVLERSVNDTGDCRIMLGSECVDALQAHYTTQAQRYAAEGGCGSNTSWNTTVPFQCADAIGGYSSWVGGLFRASIALDRSPDEQATTSDNCSSSVQPTNSSIHSGGGIGGYYNQTVRFPQPWFYTFFPNRSSSVEISSSDKVHVEIRCIRPDNIQPGSAVPPSAQELLARSDTVFQGNLSNASSTTEKGSATPGAHMTNMWSLLGIAGMVALFSIV